MGGRESVKEASLENMGDLEIYLWLGGSSERLKRSMEDFSAAIRLYPISHRLCPVRDCIRRSRKTFVHLQVSRPFGDISNVNWRQGRPMAYHTF